jgi:hypothetical protein
VVFVITDVSEENIASITRMKGIDELGTTLAVTSNGRARVGISPCLYHDPMFLEETGGYLGQDTPTREHNLRYLSLIAGPVTLPLPFAPQCFVGSCWEQGYTSFSSLVQCGHSGLLKCLSCFECNIQHRRMASSGMLRRVFLIGSDVSEELSASNIRATKIGELGTLAVTSNRRSVASYC